MTADPTSIAIKGHLTRAPIASKEVYDPFQGGFRVKIRTSLGLEPGGRSSIHKIEHLHHMLLLAVGIRRYAGRILKIELNLFQRIRALLGSVMAMRCIQDASKLAQDAPDGSCGARKGHTLRLQLLVPMQVVKYRSGTRRELSVLRRLFTNLDNPLHDTKMDMGIGCVMSPRVREHHLQIIWGSVSQSAHATF
jgi:hypothetical protein